MKLWLWDAGEGLAEPFWKGSRVWTSGSLALPCLPANWILSRNRKVARKLPSSAEEGTWRAATAATQRHWGGASRCDPAIDLAFLRPFEPPRRGLEPRLPLLIQGGERYCRVSRQKLISSRRPRSFLVFSSADEFLPQLRVVLLSPRIELAALFAVARENKLWVNHFAEIKFWFGDNDLRMWPVKDL